MSFKSRRRKSDDRYANYKGVHQISIKKGTASLGIMIIEGRHAEVGQGIFISDIQEGSAAELAGLQVGYLILAVNKDTLIGSGYDAAASLLKRSEGVVVLTVCNPNKKDDAEGGTGSRPSSRNEGGAAAKPAAPPAKPEPPADPAIAPIIPGKATVIEISTQSQSLGISLVGGSDTQVAGAVILDVYPEGMAGKDGRLQAGDQITDFNGTPITKEMTHERICLSIKLKLAKAKMTVYREDPVSYQEIDVELTKKPGKGLGLGIMNRSPPPGSYISEIMPGGPADVDGKLQKYDLIAAIDGKDLFAATHEDVSVAMKSAGPKAAIKVKRFKPVK